jgi:hypothetical protein
MIYPEMVASLAMGLDPDDSTAELEVPGRGEPLADPVTAGPGQPLAGQSLTGRALAGQSLTGRALTGRALRSLPEQWRAVLWHEASDDATPARIVELLRSPESASAALSHRALDGLRAAYLRVYLEVLPRPECRPAAGKLGDHARRALPRRDARLVSRHLGRCAQCSAIDADLGTIDAALRGVIAPLVAGRGTGAPPAAARPTPAVPGAAPLRPAGRGRRRTAVAAVAAVVLVAVAAVGAILTLDSRPARSARHPAAAGSPAATPPAQTPGPPGSAGPGPSRAAGTRLAPPRRTRSPASSSPAGPGTSPPPASTAPVPSASATLGSAPSPAPSRSPPCLVLPPLRLC